MNGARVFCNWHFHNSLLTVSYTHIKKAWHVAQLDCTHWYTISHQKIFHDGTKYWIPMNFIVNQFYTARHMIIKINDVTVSRIVDLCLHDWMKHPHDCHGIKSTTPHLVSQLSTISSSTLFTTSKSPTKCQIDSYAPKGCQQGLTLYFLRSLPPKMAMKRTFCTK